MSTERPVTPGNSHLPLAPDFTSPAKRDTRPESDSWEFITDACS